MFIFSSSVSSPLPLNTQPSWCKPSGQKSVMTPGGSHLASESDMVQSPCPAVFHSFIWRWFTAWLPLSLVQAGDTSAAIWLARKINFSKLAMTMTSWEAPFLSCIPWTTKRKRQNYLCNLSVYPLKVTAAGVSSKNERIIHIEGFVVASAVPLLVSSCRSACSIQTTSILILQLPNLHSSSGTWTCGLLPGTRLVQLVMS